MIFNRFAILLIVCFASLSGFAQYEINGSFSALADQKVKLMGFQGFGNYPIDSIQVSQQGQFTVSYADTDFGMGYLSTEDNKTFLVVLTDEGLTLEGKSFDVPETIQILKGEQNQYLEQYASEHALREHALSAWDYLTQIYNRDPLFSTQKVPQEAIATEKRRIYVEDSLFLAGLPDSYVRYYLPLRKLVSSVSVIAQYRIEQIPTTIAAFREIDYTDPRLNKSGLLAEIIESQFWLIENSGRSLDSVFIEMNHSIDVMVENLLSDEEQLNEVSEFLFKLLEKRSLFTSSEYLALRLLNEQGCTLDNNLAGQLESYRAMKTGNTASEIYFNNDVVAPGYAPGLLPEKISDLNSDYTVVVFGASWCPACPQELSSISRYYTIWQAQGVEVVFVSLDEDEQTFRNFVSVFPFISTCDYQKWESPTVQAYHVFATPTLYLLDANQEIVLRPHGTSQLNAWIDWYLINGND